MQRHEMLFKAIPRKLAELHHAKDFYSVAKKSQERREKNEFRAKQKDILVEHAKEIRIGEVSQKGLLAILAHLALVKDEESAEIVLDLLPDLGGGKLTVSDIDVLAAALAEVDPGAPKELMDAKEKANKALKTAQADPSKATEEEMEKLQMAYKQAKQDVRQSVRASQKARYV